MSNLFRDPYPGTGPFGHNDHDRFFGRSAETGALADLWLTNRLTVAAGPVGSGKTSLLNAGVLPFVSGTRAEVFAPGRIHYGSTFPFAALPEHNPYSLALLRSWAPLESPTRLVGLSVRDFVHAHHYRVVNVYVSLYRFNQAHRGFGELCRGSGKRTRSEHSDACGV